MKSVFIFELSFYFLPSAAADGKKKISIFFSLEINILIITEIK